MTEPVKPEPGAETERQGCGSLQRMVRPLALKTEFMHLRDKGGAICGVLYTTTDGGIAIIANDNFSWDWVVTAALLDVSLQKSHRFLPPILDEQPSSACLLLSVQTRPGGRT